MHSVMVWPKETRFRLPTGLVWPKERQKAKHLDLAMQTGWQKVMPTGLVWPKERQKVTLMDLETLTVMRFGWQRGRRLEKHWAKD